MPIILGVDPGSRMTGYGVVRLDGSQLTHLDSGAIAIAGKSIGERLNCIFKELSTIVKQWTPEVAAVEQVFMHLNPGGAIKLGQARGAAIVAAASLGLQTAEYSARQIKQSVTGHGGADKLQVQQMVARLLHLELPLQNDAADALAVAICHAHTNQSLSRLGGAKGIRNGRLQ
jgi:crossover junction endodeoxyribonuclease RuvC